MAGVINWKKANIPAWSPDGNHVYVGIDLADGSLYFKDSTGTVTKYAQKARNTRAVNASGPMLASDQFIRASGTINIALLPATLGFPLTVKNVGNGVVTVTPDGADVIEGQTNIQLAPGNSMALNGYNGGWDVC